MIIPSTRQFGIPAFPPTTGILTWLLWILVLGGDSPAATWFDTLPNKSSILWRHDHETGDPSQWEWGAPWSTGKSSWAITTSRSLSGNYSLSSTIDTSAGVAAVRWPRVTVPGYGKKLPTDAYYSAWYLFPTLLQNSPSQSSLPNNWLNIFQWKSAGIGALNNQSDPVWSLGLYRKSDGKTYLQLVDYFNSEGCYCGGNATSRGIADIPVVAGQWMHLEARYRWSDDPTGQIQVWQNGVEIFNLSNVYTEYDYGQTEQNPYPRQWLINVYGNALRPNPFTAYFDDAAIATRQLYPTATPGDFNRNGLVDAADYVLWRKYGGGQTQYQSWRALFGNGILIANAALPAVPEPATWMLLSTSGWALFGWFQRHHSLEDHNPAERVATRSEPASTPRNKASSKNRLR